MHIYRTHDCGALRAGDAGQTVRLSGWIHRKRDHGGVLFIDMRDHFGLTQIVVGPASPAFETLDKARLESVVTVTGGVVAREGGAVNANLATGDIEVRAQAVTVQSAAIELPLPVAGDAEYPEDIRLKYRFLDLRRGRLHANMMLRSNIIASLRRRMINQGFTEFQTPILTASSPEGARDYLVPSRVHPGKFYALPQAPQMFKQLLMVAGFDRYFQIAPCFRDEDARADRSPGEFYQLDFEMSFVTQDDVFAAIEPVLAGVFEENAGFSGRTPWAVTKGAFPRIPYAESMLKYGNDKPDLRNPIEIQDVTEQFRGSGFGLFAKMVEAGHVVRAIPSPGTAEKSRKFFDDMNDWARNEGFAGLGYVTRKGGEFGGPIAKNHGEAGIQAVYDQLGLGPDDGCFFAAGKEAQAAKLAGLARTRVGQELGIIEQNTFKFCWIVDFPMFEFDEDTKKIDFSHNPFSMPQGELEALETQDPLTIKAYQYDIVCNGVELSSGAIRNHRPEIMYKAFEIAGYSAADVDANFSGMINAFKFGAPPHGGSAPGVDRMVMLIADEPNIREVVVFPMNQKAEDLMMNAPAPATLKQLRELHIRTVD
ncbi:MAG: aspartate--tRNA ligase [Sandarakinorhabdus sp.]|nr:aspartate--tRNA ligase [Sandarakinorhabdus sp.]